MLKKETLGERIFNCCNVVFMISVMLITIYPLLYVALASLSNANQLMAHSGLLLKPIGFTTRAYEMLFKKPAILTGYKNTLIIVSVGVSINILMTSFGAYFLSRKNVMWKNAVMFFIIFTMFFSGGMIPFYLTVKGYGLYDNLWALIIPGSINTFNLIIMRTAFAAIPSSLEESAKLDGAGHFTILFRIVLPLSKAVLAVMVLYYTVGHWNAWFNAMIFLKNESLHPLQLVLRMILIQNDTGAMTTNVSVGDKDAIGETVKHAVVIVATLPILSVYPLVQKYFMKGVMIGALKG